MAHQEDILEREKNQQTNAHAERVESRPFLIMLNMMIEN